MRRKPSYVRDPGNFRSGIVCPWPAGHASADEVAQDAHYLPSGEHKSHPSPKNLWTFGPRKGKALCDTFDETQWPLLIQTLRQAIVASCVSREFRGRFPASVWAYIQRGNEPPKLHEARLSNSGHGWYHGFPLQYEDQYPEDPHGLLRNAPCAKITDH